MTEPSAFAIALRALLDETFHNARGYYLDRNTSLFETLAGISAEEASIPVGGKCATLAAQVKHVAFYLDVLLNSVRDPDYPRADWGEIWRTVGAVSPGEWQDIKDELQTNYERVLALVDETSWDLPDGADGLNPISGAISLVAHSAYHLGEIRQALCTLKP